MEEFGTVAVIGLGYIGLPTAAVLATYGVDVIGVDVNPRTVDAVNRGEVPFVEPDLATALAGAVSQGHLRATTSMPAARCYIVAVPTPFTDGHQPDLSYIDQAADAIAPQLVGDELIILESTSPPGTTRRMAERIERARPDLTFDPDDGRQIVHAAHCPERVLPGRIMLELVTNDRVVGGLTETAAERARALYAVFCQGEIILTDAVTAELAKLTENSFRDVNIAFANELSLICEELGVDVWELIEIANRHPRVQVLRPGPGVGGHCIAVDPWFIVATVPEQARLIRLAREINDSKPAHVVGKIVSAAGTHSQPVIAALGLAFKPDIDDLRESPARQVVAQLSHRLPDARIRVVEPYIDKLPPELASQPNVELVDLDEIAGSDVVVLLVDHQVFREANPADLRISDAILIDTRGAWQAGT